MCVFEVRYNVGSIHSTEISNFYHNYLAHIISSGLDGFSLHSVLFSLRSALFSLVQSLCKPDHFF